MTFTVASGLFAGPAFASADESDSPIYEEPTERIMVQTYTATDGLPATEFEAIEIDRAGFVWVATIGGLAKFDGNSFTHFAADPDDPAATPRFVIDGLAADPVSGMWATAGVMLHVDSFSGKITQTDIEARRISRADRLIWAWAPGMVRLVDPQSRKVVMQTEFPSDGLDGYNLLAISDDLAVLGGQEGIWTVNAAGDLRLHKTDVPTYGLARADDGKVWVSDDIRLSLYDPTTDSLETAVDRIEAHPGETETPITGGALLQRSDRTVWMSTNLHGVEVYEIDTDTIHLIPPSRLPTGIAGKVNNFEEDAQGGLWMGAYGIGLQYLPAGLPPVWQAAIPTAADGTEIIDAYLDLEVIDDNVWIASDGGGLHRYDVSAGAFAEPITSANSELPSDSVIGIARDGSELWLGMWDGAITRYNIDTGVFRPLKSVKEGGPVAGPNVFDIVEGPDNTMWAAVWSVGVQVFNQDGAPLRLYGPAGDVKINGELVIKIVPNHDGAAWFAGWSGIERVDQTTGEVTRWSVDSGHLVGDIVFDLYFSDDGTVWAATSAGLEHLDPVTSSTEYFGPLAGVPGPAVVQVIENPGASTIWLATADRLAEFDLRSKKVVQTYGVKDGLPKGGFARYGSAHLSGDITVISTNAGLAFARNGQVPTHDPPVYVTSLAVDDQAQAIADGEASISVDAVRLAVSFVGLDYRQPEGLTYEYRLVGLDDEWVASANPTATFSRLAAGDYRFEVRARTASGAVSSVPATISISVIPHWWQTGLARLTGVSLVFLLVGLITLGLLYRARRRNRQLERMVAERTVQLRAQTSQAQAANAAKTAFVSNVSHELRNPLQSVLGFAELISMSSTGEQQQHWAEQIHTSGSDLLSMIEELLELSSLESSTPPLQVSTVDLRTVINEIVEGIDNSPSTKQRVVADVELGHEVVWCDSRRLRQVLANLTLNADRHSTGETIVVGVREVSLFDSSGSADLGNDDSDLLVGRIARYRFSVRDEGPGMSPDEVAQAFEPFMRGKRATAPGAGLGLAISRQLVARLGGTLAVNTAPNSPTEFYFELDLRVNVASDSGHDRFDSSIGSFNERGELTVGGLDGVPGATRLSALVVDPDTHARQAIADALILLGIKVQVEPHGDRAVAAVNDPNRLFNLLILSDRLTDISASEVVEQVRQTARGRALTVLLTGTQTELDQRPPGVDAYLHKPISLMDIATSMQCGAFASAR